MQRQLQKFAFLSIALLCTPLLGLAQETSSFRSSPAFQPLAEAAEKIESALAKAKKENRSVLIVWGSDGSKESTSFLKSTTSNPQIRELLQDEFYIVRIDASSITKSQELANRFDAKLNSDLLPFLTVLDATGKPLANQPAKSLSTEATESTDSDKNGLLEFLSKVKPKPLDANVVLQKALTEAKAENKIVFLHFGAPWCGWCHRMEDWMARPATAKVLSQAFIDTKIDTDRMTGGDELLKKYCAKRGGIPWFAFLSPADEVLVTSDGPKGNVGYPSEDFEIEHFATMLEQTKRFTKEQIEELTQSLAADRRAREKK